MFSRRTFFVCCALLITIYCIENVQLAAIPSDDADDVADDIIEQANGKEWNATSHSSDDYKHGYPDWEYRWPYGIVPYRLLPGLSTQQLTLLREAMEQIESLSCIKFQLVDEHIADRVDVQPTEMKCSSSVGYRPGVRTLNLGALCDIKGKYLHELLHILGFQHEHVARDRDNYVIVLMENVKPESQRLFAINYQITDFGFGYDYGSIMHYGPRAASKNGEPTLLPLNNTIVIGQRLELSPIDVEKLNFMYMC